MMKIIIFTYLLFVSLTCNASCEEVTKRLSSVQNLEEKEVGEEVFSACKVWAAHPEKSIVAIARFQRGSNMSTPPVAGIGFYDLEVLVVGNKNHKVLHRLFQKAALSSDANRLVEITVDTAHYMIGRNTDAFGIRAEFRNNSRSNPSRYQTMNLYAVEGAMLKQVLSNFVMSRENSERLGEDCIDTSSTINRKVAGSHKGRDGYADLIVYEKTTAYERKPGKEGCDGTEASFSRRGKLHFNGDMYVVPQSLRD